MSRCFPFPPPGYEKKPTTNEPDLLKKEKRKEKKHKKDKKDKEKKDRSEKQKDKKEKKEKKEKHRDKKKDKEKSKTTTPDENRIHNQFEGYNGEKLDQNKEKTISTTQFTNQNGDSARNRIKVGDPESYKFVQELDRRIRDEEKGTGSHQFVGENNINKIEIQKTDVVVPNRINGATPPGDKRIEKKEEKGCEDKRGDKRKNKDREKEKHKNEKKEAKVREKSERDKNKHVKKTEFVGNYNTNLLENSGNLKKRKDMETNGVSHENEPRPNKMARPGSNISISPENGRKLVSIQNQNPSSSLLDKQGAPLNGFKVASKGGQTQSQSQRVNGMIPSQPVSIPTKKPPISPFNHIQSKPSPIKSPSPPVLTNHFAAQSPPVPTPKPPPPNHIAADHHHQPPAPKPPPAIHNPITTHHHHQLPPLSSPSPSPSPQPPVTTAKQPPVSRPKPPPTGVKAAGPPPPPPKKPPHPDTKYLNQILSVPKLDPWCGLDDQEWLFSNKTGRPVSNKTELQDPVQVWSEAKHIESVDVCALPYVIPY